MLKLITFALILIPFLVQAKTEWSVREVPEAKYLFRPLPAKSKVFTTDVKNFNGTIIEMRKFITKSNVSTNESVLYNVDPKSFELIEVGLEVSGPNVPQLPSDQLKIRPAGRYLVCKHTFPSIGIGEVLQELQVKAKELNVTLKGGSFYMYKVSLLSKPDNVITLYLFKVE